ncbi:Gfo/Idh/MocA family protein [Alicyclobacillus kakegawensis]|uniref:Gfo/Idh/MocA family protein n=1 Tax=Alicyclobacillus kakegawensis TaxID=392012 RepID=UPI00082B61BD|nr:Gfo/Idh/MocA family oxidoreductase [Alicyclobacillus kakegawensis]
MLNVAVVGAGGLARRRAEILQSLSGVRVSAMIGRSRRGAAVAEELGVPFTTSLVDGVRNADAVVVSISTDQHLPVVEQLLLEAKKPLLLEKPLASNLTDCIQMCRLIEEAGVPVHIGYQRRFLPDYVRAHTVVRSGDLGRVFVCLSTSRDRVCPDARYIRTSGGIWRDLVIHDINLIRWFMNDEVEWVEGLGTNGDTEYLKEMQDFEDVLGVMQFASGGLGYVGASRTAHHGCDIRTEVWGETGSVFVELDERRDLALLSKQGIVRQGFTDYLDVFGRAFVEEVKAWVKSMVDGTPGMITVQEALKDSIVAEAFTLSANEGRRVYVEEVRQTAAVS